MINKLRRRFIRIAILSVTVVMLVLCMVVNIANFWSRSPAPAIPTTVPSTGRPLFPPGILP